LEEVVKFRKEFPLTFNGKKVGTLVFENEIPARTIANLRWQWAHMIKTNEGKQYMMPVIKERKKRN
jgi:hypothetical protein